MKSTKRQRFNAGYLSGTKKASMTFLRFLLSALQVLYFQQDLRVPPIKRHSFFLFPRYTLSYKNLVLDKSRKIDSKASNSIDKFFNTMLITTATSQFKYSLTAFFKPPVRYNRLVFIDFFESH